MTAFRSAPCPTRCAYLSHSESLCWLLSETLCGRVIVRWPDTSTLNGQTIVQSTVQSSAYQTDISGGLA